MAQPPAHVIDGDAVQKQVPGVGMAKGMGPHRAPLGQGAQGFGPGCRFLRPARGSGTAGAHYRAPSHAGELKDGGQGVLQLRVDRHDAGAPSFALAHSQGGQVRVQGEVGRLQGQGLGDPQPGPPLEQEKQPGFGVGGGGQDG